MLSFSKTLKEHSLVKKAIWTTRKSRLLQHRCTRCPGKFKLTHNLVNRVFFYEFVFLVIKTERLSSDMSTGNPTLDQHKVMHCLAGLLHYFIPKD